MADFNRIGLVGRPGHAGVIETLNRLLIFLGEKDLSIVLDDLTAALLTDHGQQECRRDELSKYCDLVIVVGGDGTSRDVAKGWLDAPLLAVSTGTNNVFPVWTEATSVGTAAGLVASGQVPMATAARRAKVLHVSQHGPPRGRSRA